MPGPSGPGSPVHPQLPPPAWAATAAPHRPSGGRASGGTPLSPTDSFMVRLPWARAPRDEARVHPIRLPRAIADEDQPAVECGCPPPTTPAGPDPQRRQTPLDRLAQPDLLVADESRQAHPERRGDRLVGASDLVVVSGHDRVLL